MNILHIASIENDPYSGVPCMVPRMIRAENRLINISFLNIRNVQIDSLKDLQIEIQWENGCSIKNLPEPFDNPDLVVFHEVYYPGFLPISKELRERGIPYIIVPHGCLTSEAQNIKKYKKLPANILLFNRYIYGAVCLRFLSDNEKQNTLNSFRMSCFSLGTGIKLMNDGKNEFRTRKDIRFSYIGRVDSFIKGLDLLVEAIRDKADFLGVNGCRFYIYGPDANNSKRALHGMIKELEIEGLVKICSPVSDERKKLILKNTDVFVLTSRSEGLPLGVLEALSYGVPCLVSKGTGLSEQINSYNAGWGETDESSIADLLKKAVDEIQKLEEKSTNAIRLIKDRFSEEENTKKLIKIYKKIINSNR